MSTQLQTNEKIEVTVATTATLLILLSAALNSPIITVFVSVTALTVMFFTHRFDSKTSLYLAISAAVLAAAIAGVTVFLSAGRSTTD